MLKKLVIIMFAIALPAILATTTIANAQGHKPYPKLDYCSPGTCAKDGTSRACNIKNCSGQNCRT
jgi:hypothetical protein